MGTRNGKLQSSAIPLNVEETNWAKINGCHLLCQKEKERGRERGKETQKKYKLVGGYSSIGRGLVNWVW